MDNGVITVKVSREGVQALRNLNSWLIGEYYPEGHHEMLLMEFLVQMDVRLEKMLQKSGTKFAITLTSFEALAFCQVWGPVGVDHDQLGKVTVCDIIGKIDKTVKQQRING